MIFMLKAKYSASKKCVLILFIIFMAASMAVLPAGAQVNNKPENKAAPETIIPITGFEIEPYNDTNEASADYNGNFYLTGKIIIENNGGYKNILPERLEIRQQWNEMQEACPHLTKNKVHY